VSIAPAILSHYPDLNDAQRSIIGHVDGPLLVIAGPGSGKTYSIVLRALNLLLLGRAQPDEIVLCTFTEKAAFEMRDRMAAAARKVEFKKDLSGLTVCTIHGLCNRILAQHRHRTALGHNYDTLDELTQLLFVFEHFDKIIGSAQNDLYLGRWKTRWTAIEGALGYFDKIHRIALDGKLDALNESRIRELFDRTFRFLCLSDVRPIGDQAREAAHTQVLNCFRKNQDEMRRVIQTEVDVSLEKDGYILAGKVDLLLGGDGKLELLDFKTSPRPRNSPELIADYERQLCTYAHILEQRHGRHVDRLLLYWTSEARKQDALMVLPYDPRRVEEAGKHFDETVRRIQAQEFAVRKSPEASICKECDLRMLCNAEGIIHGAEVLA